CARWLLSYYAMDYW
nr:immunoglobulin heavy chain junction region [Mus musculus]